MNEFESRHFQVHTRTNFFKSVFIFIVVVVLFVINFVNIENEYCTYQNHVDFIAKRQNNPKKRAKNCMSKVFEHRSTLLIILTCFVWLKIQSNSTLTFNISMIQNGKIRNEKEEKEERLKTFWEIKKKKRNFIHQQISLRGYTFLSSTKEFLFTKWKQK